MTQDTEKRCAHPSCNCLMQEEETYCSEACEAAAATAAAGADCGCDHLACTTAATL